MNVDIIAEHYRERALLLRRITLLDELDELARAVYEAEPDDDETIDSILRKYLILERNFEDVADPIDIERGLKAIYLPRHYGPEEEDNDEDDEELQESRLPRPSSRRLSRLIIRKYGRSGRR
jgi:hypothetical protein